MSGSYKWREGLNVGRSYCAPSYRLKRLAWSGYGFGHTSRREPGDVRGTVIGKKGRFRGLQSTKGGDV